MYRVPSGVTYALLCQDDPAQELILKAFHGDSEVNDGCLGTDLRRVSRVGELSGYVETESLHHIHFLVSNFHLEEKKI